jgi:NAD(P)-dependent dehydrogenase (short-subunit alcohol dehydrogenase family)
LIETAAKSSKIAWHVMDASDETSIIDAMTAADDIDIMVANAGIADTSPVAKITMDHWRKVFATNVEGVMVCTREAVRQMVPRGWGRIIIVSSVAGLKGAPYIGAYSASKHAVLGLMKSAADETMTKGVTVNAICPAYVLTELVQKGIDNIVEKTGVTAEEATQQLANVNPFKRLIETDEVAAAAMWLCGPGSGAITGQAIPVSGGQV